MYQLELYAHNTPLVCHRSWYWAFQKFSNFTPPPQNADGSPSLTALAARLGMAIHSLTDRMAQLEAEAMAVSFILHSPLFFIFIFMINWQRKWRSSFDIPSGLLNFRAGLFQISVFHIIYQWATVDWNGPVLTFEQGYIFYNYVL